MAGTGSPTRAPRAGVRATRTSRCCSSGPSPCSRRRWSNPAPSRRRDPRHGRPHRGAAASSARRRPWSGIDRDPQALALAGRRLAPFGDRVTRRARGLRRDPRGAGRSRAAAGAGRPVRPRGLLAAARRARARLRLLRRRPARHAHGPDDRPHRRRRPQHLRRRRASPGSCASTARSGSRRASPGPSSGSGRASPSRPARGWWTSSAPTCPRRPGGPAATPPSARSRRCGSR